MIGWGIRQLFSNQGLLPGLKARELAIRLSGVKGATFIWCKCGRPLMPIMFDHGDDQPEVVALACPKHGAVPVCVGIVCENIDP